jgi:Flp pilus assembly protein TadG
MRTTSTNPERGKRARDERGQGLVEFTMLVPVFLVMLFGMLEFGFAFNHNLTIEYATREGARAGAALANGTSSTGNADVSCVDNAGNPTTLVSSDVDKLVIAAVQRVLKSPGSMVRLTQVPTPSVQITIYKANPANGQDSGTHNVWVYTPGAGPRVPCQASAPNLDFSPQTTGWTASTRLNGATPDSIGIAITYTYKFTTPLATVLRFFGGASAATLTMTDRSVMALEPTS